MGIAMRMGLRNLRRRPGRTLLTVGMLMFGTFLVVWSIGMNEGPYADMIRMGTGTWLGQLHVEHEGYKESPSLYEAVERPAPIIKALEADPDVKAVSARVEVAGLLSVGTRTAGAMLTGVMPDREPKVTTLPNTVKEGAFLTQPADPEALPIVLGRGLARRLKVKLGQEVVYMGQASDGSIAAEVFVLVGVMESGSSELDASLAMIRLKDAQELLVLGERVHQIVARTTSPDAADAVARRLADSPLIPKPARLMTWRQLSPQLWASIESDRAGGAVFVIVIVLMVVLGAVNAMLMSVFERTRELGVMKALGATPGHLIAVVVWESVGTALVGVGLGVLCGALLNEYLAGVGLQFFDEPVEFGGMELSMIYPMNTFRGTVQYPLMIFAASVLGGLWPAWRASRLDPTSAIRDLT